MINVYMILRSLAFLAGASAAMFDINGWMTVMLGPDCWNYSARELGTKASGRGPGTLGYDVSGVDAASLSSPLAQALRYSVSGVGVHLMFIGVVVLLLGFRTPRGDPLHVLLPLSMLLLDALTVLNATGQFDPATAGHPRCATSSFSECAGALQTFVPVVVLDGVALGLAGAGLYPAPPKVKAA